jgi:cobalt-precorrin 5A hydrolase
MDENIGVVCITRQGINIARKIKGFLPSVVIYAQSKHNDSRNDIIWYEDSASNVMSMAFQKHSALICIFSLGAVIRLISPLVLSKKTDPAVLVVDDKANFVISALSGHLGGANELARKVANQLNSRAVITTAADVNETIAVDLLGRDLGWTIENYENVTKVSAFVVNEERVGIFQDAGEKNWWPQKNLPKNLILVDSLEDLLAPEFKGGIIISDGVVIQKALIEKSVIYRPKSLVVGVGLHRDTSAEDIENGIEEVFKKSQLVFTSVRNISTIDSHEFNSGLRNFSNERHVPLRLYSKGSLADVIVPNPSQIVKKYEGINSVSEASAILSSGGNLIVPKRKFPPNLTLAVARIDTGEGHEKGNTVN